jgi:Zn-dependent protease with chaperone function
MNFFDHQDQARKRTGQLVFLFFVAVVLLIIMTNILVAAFLGFLTAGEEQVGFNAFLAQLNWHNLGLVSLGVIAVVGGGTLFRLSSLAATGGKGVAEMLGGSLVNHDNVANDDERQLLNVVEEMAIASGTPTPPVYVMKNEKGINAFAAGFNVNDAVIGVTKGCIEQLNRDELQGVIAHEFSHILHGDMRINLRLMGVLHGILLIGLIGYHLLDTLWWSSRRRDKKEGQIGIIGLAIGLIVVGYGGVFIGNLIKAAVSRPA